MNWSLILLYFILFASLRFKKLGIFKPLTGYVLSCSINFSPQFIHVCDLPGPGRPWAWAPSHSLCEFVCSVGEQAAHTPLTGLLQAARSGLPSACSTAEGWRSMLATTPFFSLPGKEGG